MSAADIQIETSGKLTIGHPRTIVQKGDTITCPCMSAIGQKATISPYIAGNVPILYHTIFQDTIIGRWRDFLGQVDGSIHYTLFIGKSYGNCWVVYC
jgi:hypothetical protein